MNNFLDIDVPTWAINILIQKGLGFEDKIVHAVIWDYFSVNFSQSELDTSYKTQYFNHYIDTMSKNGDIEKAINFAKEQRSQVRERPSNQLKQVKQSALSEFEDKYKDYL